MAVPLLLELTYWLTPGVSAGPLLDRLVQSFLRLLASGATTPDDFVNVASQIQPTVDALRDVNVLETLGWQIPTVLGSKVNAGFARPIELQGWTTFGALTVALLIGGLVIAAIYFALIAQVVREGHSDIRTLVQRLSGAVGRYIGYVGLVVALVAGIVTLGMAFLVISTVFGASAAALGVVAGGLGFLMLRIYLMFGDEAVFVSDHSAVAAIRTSFRIVGRSFWSVLGIYFLVSVLMGVGLNIVWARLVELPFGALPAAAGHAFVETGTAAALMVYYLDRRPDTKLPATASPVPRLDSPSSGTP